MFFDVIFGECNQEDDLATIEKDRFQVFFTYLSEEQLLWAFVHCKRMKNFPSLNFRMIYISLLIKNFLRCQKNKTMAQKETRISEGRIMLNITKPIPQ